jgi:hypothetical protein
MVSDDGLSPPWDGRRNRVDAPSPLSLEILNIKSRILFY